MNYIRINCNKNYVNKRAKRHEFIYTSLLSLFFIVFGIATIFGVQRDIRKINLKIVEKSNLLVESTSEVKKLNKEINNLNRGISEKNSHLKDDLYIKDLVGLVPDRSITNIIRVLELPTTALKLQFNDFSIRGDEVSFYIQNPKVDLEDVITEFEKYFGEIVITEHSNERLNIRLGDLYDY